MQWRVPLADVEMTDADIDAIAATYRSGWLSMGPRIAEFEAAFAEYAGAAHAIAVASGTAALHLQALAAGIGPGDEVIVPSMTFVATVNAIRYTGATPVFADILSPAEPWLSAAAVERAVTPRTRAIAFVSYGGHAGPLAAIAELAEGRDLILLHDAAHAIGARLDGRPLGGIAAASAYSFFSNKNLALGEGGMVTTGDEALAARVRLLRSHGMTAVSWDRARGHASGYDVVELGFNHRLDEPRAALGLERLRRLDADTARRAALVARYRIALDGIVECCLPPAQGSDPAHHLFTILVAPGADREAIRARIAEQGVQTSVHYPPAHRFAIYADSGAELPVTDEYAARTITLPLFAHMTVEQHGLVVAAVAGAVGAPTPVG
jgi:dTDP-4-amino-4,6-dideoxygalactose transaminase